MNDSLLDAILSLNRQPPTSPLRTMYDSPPKIPLSIRSKPILPTRIPLVRITPTTEVGAIKRVREDVARIVKTQLRHTTAEKIPTIEDVAYDEAKTLQTSVMHIDIRQSSNIVKLYNPTTALKIYKIFHSTLVSIIRYKEGRIRTFAGDRIAAFFDINNRQRSQAVETALFIQMIIGGILNPILLQMYGFSLDYGVGIDFGKMLVGRIGQYRITNNDLVWAGVPVNFASKLADYGSGIYISNEVYTKMDKALKETVGMIWTPITDPVLGSFYKYIGLPKKLPND